MKLFSHLRGWFRLPGWDSPHLKLAFRFENRWLRLTAHVSLLGLPVVLWILAPYLWDRGPALAFMTSQYSPKTSPPIEVASVLSWLILLCVAAYYGHLVFRRFQLSLLPFMFLVLSWGHSTAIIWASAGWEAGLTMFLAVGALLGYAVTWGQSVARFCKMRGKAAHAGLVVLGALTPMAFFVLLFGLLLAAADAYAPNQIQTSGRMLIYCILSWLCGLLVLIPAFWLTRRCRLAAREVLAADSATVDASADATPTEAEPPVLGQRAHAAWIVLHKRRRPLVLVVIFCGVFVPYISLVARGMSLARRNKSISRQTFMALAPKPVPDSENAALHWRDAFAATTRRAGNAQDQDWRDEATFAAGSSARALLAGSAKAFPLADTAADSKRCNWGLKYEDLTNIQLKHLAPMREMVRHLAVRAHVAAYDGDWTTVHRSLWTMVAGVDDMATGPSMVTYFIANTVEQLAAGTVKTLLSVPGVTPTEKDFIQLEKLVRERLRPSYKMSDAWRSESLMFLATIDQVAAGKQRESFVGTGNLPGVLNWYGVIYPADRDYYRMTSAKIISRMEAVENGRTAPFPQGSFKFVFLKDDTWVFHLMSLMFTMNSNPSIERAVEAKVQWRLALLGLAVKRHALAHGGAWPASLAELGFEADELVDPFDLDQKPIRYRIDIDGSALLWSVGPDHKDNGGRPLFFRNGDIVFHLYAPVAKSK